MRGSFYFELDRIIRVFSLVLFFSLVVVPGLVAADDAFPVSILLRETVGIQRSGELVTLGLPVGISSGLTGTEDLAVFDGNGALVPAQFKVLSRWGGPPDDATKPVRWVLADFPATLAAQGRAHYQITRMEGLQAPSLPVTEDAASISVDTGAAVFRISKSTPNLLDSVLVQNQETLNRNDPRNGVSVTTFDSSILTSINDASILRTEITENGPVKVVVRQEIQFEDPRLADNREGDFGLVYTSGVPWLYDDSEAGRSRLRISFWYTFVKSSGAVRLRARVENVNTCMIGHWGGAECGPVSSLNSVRFNDLSLHLGFASAPESLYTSTVSVDATGETLVFQDSSGQDSWDYYTKLQGTWKRYARDVTFRGYEIRMNGSVIDSGNHAPGWLAYHSADRTLSMGVAAPWKHFPVAIRASGPEAALEIALYPEEFSRDHTLRAGERSTHECVLFVGADPELEAAPAAQAWIESPIAWSWPAEYGLSTRALPGFSLHGLEPDYELWNSTTIDVEVSRAHNQMTWWEPGSTLLNRDLHGLYGKDVYGYLINDNEQKTSTDLSKYNQYRGFLRQALRTARNNEAYSDTWWELGIEANRAQADSGYLVQPYAVQDSIWTGINFAHCFHESPMDLDFPRGSGFGCDFSGDIGGMIELYYLTGYEPALDSVLSHLNNTYSRSGADSINRYDLDDRLFGSRIEILLQGWQLTGDQRYLDQAIRLANLVGADDSTHYLQCPCPQDPADTVFVGPLFMGWLLRSMGWLADEMQAIGQTDTASYRHLVGVLQAHADWYIDKVMIHDTTNDLWVLPYHWYTNDTTGINQDPSYSAYALMAADALALAYKHGGNPTHLEAAQKLFSSTMACPFAAPGEWQFGVYSTINEAGKFAEFGGTFITIAHSSSPPDNQPPTAVLQVEPALGPAPLEVQADASESTDPDGQVASYTWDWGEGTDPETTQSPTASHTYTTGPAEPTITLTVIDDQGLSDTASRTIQVEAPAAVIESITGTGLIRGAAAPGVALVYFNIARTLTGEAYTGTICVFDSSLGILMAVVIADGDPVTSSGDDSAHGSCSGFAFTGQNRGSVQLDWSVTDPGTASAEPDSVAITTTGAFEYVNTAVLIAGDLKILYSR